ncbi:MAG: hypothetical protein E5W81_01645 [Mesorhizobium sp.]|nr:MAG: hypothetical protein EOS27_33365 [Mesorhizobium sp.]RWC37835.1 MAG: hypothetical protein EOS28_31680 [Mesorhizobium sp.]RWG64780.1 MAG: hypothetical protein EOQ67_29110 [Mesorhizobium sp.]RWI30401.1 MAG: hypothetical protein EOR13_31410 [Mesorhizobium sp.]RWI45683.1 MAG: hypothetical protein EOQ93_30675 [Mesorhizobium sp.]
MKGSRRKKGVPSVFRAFPFEIHSRFQLAESRNKFRGRQQANWLGALWFPWTRYCFDPNNELISQIGCSAFEEAVRVGHPCPEFAEVMPSLGRLGQSIEGGGKRRIFAIGNWVIPRVLHPLHKWCMTVLSTLPMDGTFNQTAPVERLAGSSITYSVDLKESRRGNNQ